MFDSRDQDRARRLQDGIVENKEKQKRSSFYSEKPIQVDKMQVSYAVATSGHLRPEKSKKRKNSKLSRTLDMKFKG
jgi:hypothetical protein